MSLTPTQEQIEQYSNQYANLVREVLPMLPQHKVDEVVKTWVDSGGVEELLELSIRVKAAAEGLSKHVDSIILRALASTTPNLDQALGLHQQIEIWYVVDGYTARLENENEQLLAEARGDSVADAIANLEKVLEARRDKREWVHT